MVWTIYLKLFLVNPFEKCTAWPLRTILDIYIFFFCRWDTLEVHVFSGSDVCTIVTICLAIRQSGERCPCQEGGQGTNSFLFLDTFIYQAWLHVSHTLKVGLCTRLCVYVCWLETRRDEWYGVGETDGDVVDGGFLIKMLNPLISLVGQI